MFLQCGLGLHLERLEQRSTRGAVFFIIPFLIVIHKKCISSKTDWCFWKNKHLCFNFIILEPFINLPVIVPVNRGNGHPSSLA